MDLVEWVFVPAIKRSASAGQQISHAQTDNDRHQRGDELETAHEVLRILHRGAELIRDRLRKSSDKCSVRDARAIPIITVREVNLVASTTSPARNSKLPARCLQLDRCGERLAMR